MSALILRRPPSWAAVSKDGHGHGRASRHPSRRARKRALLRTRLMDDIDMIRTIETLYSRSLRNTGEKRNWRYPAEALQ
jgi:hypothetical protein